jgi:uncharacterized protein YndB with AHSA1/START domain
VIATANVAEGVVNGVVEIAAPPEAVFEALTDPRQLEAWWGADDEYRTHDWKIELRVGGQWSVRTTGPSGREMTVKGEYLQVERPHLLQLTWLASWDDFRPTFVRFEIEPAPAGTRLTMRHSGFADRAKSSEEHAAGWTRVLDWLDAYLRPDTREE